MEDSRGICIRHGRDNKEVQASAQIAFHNFSAYATVSSGILSIVTGLTRASEMDGVDENVIITSEFKIVKRALLWTNPLDFSSGIFGIVNEPEEP